MNPYNNKRIVFTAEQLSLLLNAFNGFEKEFKPMETLVSSIFAKARTIDDKERSQALVTCGHDIMENMMKHFFALRAFQPVVSRWLKDATDNSNQSREVGISDSYIAYSALGNMVQGTFRRPKQIVLRSGKTYPGRWSDNGSIPVVIEKARCRYISSVMDTWHQDPTVLEDFEPVMQMLMAMDVESDRIKAFFTPAYDDILGLIREYNAYHHKNSKK